MAFEETTRGFEYLKNIIESGKILRVHEPARQVNQGFSYLIEISALSKSWYFSLSRDNIDDLPGSNAYHASANALARSLDKRFSNIDPNLFVTLSRRLLRIEIEWPPQPKVTAAGVAAASVLWATIHEVATGAAGRCVVEMTHAQTSWGEGSDPFLRPGQLMNTIRASIDAGTTVLYPGDQSLPKQFPATIFRTGGYNDSHPSVEEYVAQKVWLLAFIAGTGDSRIKAWIADPWDADYVGCTVADLRRAAAVLNAQEKINLDEDGEFASIGKVLLASNGPVRVTDANRKPTFRTARSQYSTKKGLGEGGSGRVLLVTDQDGDEFALKYLKPEVQSQQKGKRFRNELDFCTKNTHSNIITIEDSGLAEVDGVEVPFFVMPVFPKTLRTLMRAQAPPEKHLLLFADILNGIEHAHEVSLWHRDLKPENILVTEHEDRAVVTDFGIAHFEDQYLHTAVDTLPQERLANFRYAAPEQRGGGEIDQRADIYALGLILYELFTGQLLQGTQHRKIGSINPKFSYLDPIVEGMTCQSPADRPNSISLVREMLIANSPPDISEQLQKRFDHKTTATIVPNSKPVLASAKYEIKGTSFRVETLVRPHAQIDGTHTFNTSNGEVFNGTEKQVADRFVETDRRLRDEGYTRMNSSNLSGKSLFDL